MKPKVIVTGGAGFLGSHLVPELIRKGYEVLVIDNLAAGKMENVPEEAQFLNIDIRDKQALFEAFEAFSSEGPIAGVFHLAALPRVQFSIDSPEEAWSVNVDGMRNVFEATKKFKAGRLVYSASSSAYGNQEVLPLHEGLVPNPMSPYALHKYIGEHLAKNYSLHYGLPTVSLRYFNIYGPNADPNGPYAQAIIKFIYQRKEGKPITVTGDGLQTRDSVHVRDVVRANILALTSTKVGNGEVINIGTGRSYTVLDVAKMVGGEIVFIAPRVEPKHTRADIRLAKELLGWEPTITLEEGISELRQLHGLS